jgi:hypothetical protein
LYAHHLGGRQGPIEEPDDVGDGHLVGGSGQPEAAALPFRAEYEAGSLQRQQDLLKKR